MTFVYHRIKVNLKMIKKNYAHLRNGDLRAPLWQEEQTHLA